MSTRKEINKKVQTNDDLLAQNDTLLAQLRQDQPNVGLLRLELESNLAKYKILQAQYESLEKDIAGAGDESESLARKNLQNRLDTISKKRKRLGEAGM